MVNIKYNRDTAYIFCDVCGVQLGKFFMPSPSAHQVVFLHSCSHYEWEDVGEYCIEFPTSSRRICDGVEDVIRDHVFHIEDGGHIYYLVPRVLG